MKLTDVDVVVVGAGLAGLSCARHLMNRRVSCIVLEADDRIGGRLKTDVLDGFLLNHGFQGLPRGPAPVRLPSPRLETVCPGGDDPGKWQVLSHLRSATAPPGYLELPNRTDRRFCRPSANDSDGIKRPAGKCFRSFSATGYDGP
jgi:phytoene dehydrogenase-like protein